MSEIGIIAVAAVAVAGWWWWRSHANVGASGSTIHRAGDRDVGPLDSFRQRLLTWLGAVERREVDRLTREFASQHDAFVSRLAHLEAALSQEGSRESWADIEYRLSRLEAPPQRTRQPQRAHSDGERSQSLLCLGVRVTLSEDIWRDLGRLDPQEIADHRVEQMIQGPFCRNCLRSLIVSNGERGGRDVRPRCRYCSLAWNGDTDASVPLATFKRRVYDYLDAESRRVVDVPE